MAEYKGFNEGERARERESDDKKRVLGGGLTRANWRTMEDV